MDSTLTALRTFNRFYTRFVGALEPRFLGTDLTLVEARMLWEIANCKAPLARELQDALGLDAGYASRIVRGFETKGWVRRGRGEDARRRPIALTEAGRAVFADLDQRQRAVLTGRIDGLPAHDRAALAAALDGARAILGGEAVGYAIRPFRPGDLGIIAARQAILYAEGYGWGTAMEVLLLDVCAGFVRDFKSGREQCWIAERSGRIVGSVFLVDAGDNVAQLRLLYVEADARGLGIGADLVGRCVAFARGAGYRRMTLWTHTILESARRLYAAEGFVRTRIDMHDTFGEPVQGETWELALDA